MPDSKMITGIYTSTKNMVKAFFDFLKTSPGEMRGKFSSIRGLFEDFRHRLHNLSETNLELGLHHLQKQNINDAILRFKLVDKFFSSGDKTANYWLGWAYFLKNDYSRAITHLDKAAQSDTVNLGGFLRNYTNCHEIPPEIWRQYRNLTAHVYANRYNSDTIHLPFTFIQNILRHLKEIPATYNILELGSNIGLAGYEIKRRFPDSFILTGVENSEVMSKLSNILYPDIQIYDQLVNSAVPAFLNQAKTRYDLIISFCGLTFTNDLKTHINSIITLMQPGGYLALCLPTNHSAHLSLKRGEFIFKFTEVTDLLKKNNITLLDSAELSLGINNKYSILIGKK